MATRAGDFAGLAAPAQSVEAAVVVAIEKPAGEGRVKKELLPKQRGAGIVGKAVAGIGCGRRQRGGGELPQLRSQGRGEDGPPMVGRLYRGDSAMRAEHKCERGEWWERRAHARQGTGFAAQGSRDSSQGGAATPLMNPISSKWRRVSRCMCSW